MFEPQRTGAPSLAELFKLSEPPQGIFSLSRHAHSLTFSLCFSFSWCIPSTSCIWIYSNSMQICILLWPCFVYVVSHSLTSPHLWQGKCIFWDVKRREIIGSLTILWNIILTWCVFSWSDVPCGFKVQANKNITEYSIDQYGILFFQACLCPSSGMLWMRY